MKKYFFVLFILFIAITVKAQLWCTPNSVWHYDTSNPLWNTTYTKQTYLYDTLVLGTTFNKIKSETHGTGSSGAIDNYGYYYTSLQNKVVFFNSTNSNIVANDTLMYFGPIGAKWYCWKNGGISCAQSYIEIVDTGVSVIQGHLLKWRKVNYTNYYLYGTTNQTVNTGTDTIFERIGYKHLGFQLLGYCSDVPDVAAGYFRCFQDNQIYINATNKVCDFTTGLFENKDYLNSISIYPNPTSGNVNLKIDNLKTGEVKVIVCDVMGKEVYEALLPINKGFSNFYANLSFGTYLVKIINLQTNEAVNKKLIIQK